MYMLSHKETWNKPWHASRNSLWIICFWVQRSQEVVKSFFHHHYMERKTTIISYTWNTALFRCSQDRRHHRHHHHISPWPTCLWIHAALAVQFIDLLFSQYDLLIIKCSSIAIRKPIVFTTVELLADFMWLKHLRKKVKMGWRSASYCVLHKLVSWAASCLMTAVSALIWGHLCVFTQPVLLDFLVPSILTLQQESLPLCWGSWSCCVRGRSGAVGGGTAGSSRLMAAGLQRRAEEITETVSRS